MPSQPVSSVETPWTRARDHLLRFRLYSRVHLNPYTFLADLRLLEFAINRLRRQTVQGLREEGATWREIGEALNLTESQARHQYGGVDSNTASSNT